MNEYGIPLADLHTRACAQHVAYGHLTILLTKNKTGDGQMVTVQPRVSP